MTRAVLLRGLLALTAAFAVHAPAQAQANAFPQRPVTLIVPFPPGGPSDALARGFALHMGKQLGQPVIIENVAGAGGTIGLTKVAKAACAMATRSALAPSARMSRMSRCSRSLPFEPRARLPAGRPRRAPRSMLLCRAPTCRRPISRTSSRMPCPTGPRLTFGSAGVGSISHYACVLLLSNLKLNITHVPYRGVAPAMNDLMGGHVDFMCDQTTTALPQVLGGTIKAIAALSDQPLPQAPQVPTAGAAGYRDVNLRSWNAIFVRKGTPAPVRQRLNDALRAALADPDVVRQMTAVGVELPRGTDLEPGAVSALIAQGLEHDVPVLRAKGEYLD